ncbi:MAG: calcium-translocating P-type ATPase [Defluviitaleaceae bacterium]|nr:calcium-translocating P-type ATPase [Defluviitaleaceae bacterium]MCL2238429.1 calcium-translocating P-type ATPase [Defluviitaleaceae bacterium]
MKWVTENIKDVLHTLGANPTQGLSADEIKARQQEYGLNEFEEEKKETFFQKILHHLTEIPTMILIAASVIAAIAAVMNQRDGTGTASDWAKVVVILSIVVINVVLGMYQESKAEKALEALKKMNAFKTTVIRGGVKQIIEANQLVPGDLVELNAGDVITADGRIIEASSLQVEEAALTGESQPVEKDPHAVITETVPLGDRINMVYSGCLVTGGRALVVVTETAMETEMGKIARMLNNTKKMLTPLQLRLKQLAKRISVIALLSGVAMFLVGLVLWQNDPIYMLLLAVALGVAAVPETLPIVVTMILSYGVWNMVNKKTIIRKIPAVETVGNTSVICSDKTGTLTMNKMVIQKAWHVDHDPITVKEKDFNADQRKLIGLLASCSNATIEVHGDEDEHVIGDPTEIAIIRLLHDLGINRVEAERDYPRVHELPFDSGRKRMTTVHRTEEGYIAVTKGAFDRIPVDWDKCPGLLERATAIHDSFAERALRVIAISVKKFAHKPTDLSEEALESGQELRGLVGMIDPPRPESKYAVARAKEAGIKTVMITGDHKATAIAIAREIGIYQDGDIAVTGNELSAMSETDLNARVRGISVYARVSPEDKLRIVRAWNYHNAVVTMTGDGVNDAPALKAADVGAAMGITGTEVSKNAADMVITDDNFATIVDAIAEGRTSYDNIRKIIQFLLGVNFAEIFVLLLGMLVIGISPITAMQILIINVVYDGIPGFFLAFERPEPGVMKRKPLPKGSGVFANRVGLFIGLRAVSFSILTLAAFVIGSYLLPHTAGFGVWDGTFAGLREGDFAVGITMAFMVLSWASLIDIFNTRTKLSIFQAGFTTNKGIFFTVIGAFAFSVFVALNPFLMSIFSVVHVSGTHWLIMGALAVVQVFFVEAVKLILRIRDSKKGIVY